MTDKQIVDTLKKLVIITDTREQKNDHIISWLDEHNIKHRTEKLEFGDYSAELPPEYNLDIPSKLSIEKKNSLTEIAGNFSSGRARFEREFQRAVDSGARLHLLIENATWTKLRSGTYGSQLLPKAFEASICSWTARFGTPVWFCKPDESGELIYNILYYGVREMLKNA